MHLLYKFKQNEHLLDVAPIFFMGTFTKDLNASLKEETKSSLILHLQIKWMKKYAKNTTKSL